LYLFDLADRADDEHGMREAWEAIRDIEGRTGTLARYDQARLLLRAAKRGEKERLAEARKILDQVAHDRPDWSRPPLALAEIEELEQETALAIKHYGDAVDLGERAPAVVRRFVELLYQRRRYRDADAVIQRLSAQSLAFEHLHRLAAEVALQVED